MTNKKHSVGVLGGGISGLSASYILSKKGMDVTVYEKESSVGGAIKTVAVDDWLVEEGPNTLMVKSNKIWGLLEDLNLKSKCIEAGKTAQKRFIVKHRQPLPVPMSFTGFLSSDLFSARAKFRLLKEPFASQSNKKDESISDFISRRLGKEPLDYAINPFVSGIYAGDPEELSVKHTFEPLWNMERKHGSMFKGIINRDKHKKKAKRALLSFERGNQQLPRALAEAISGTVKTNTKITRAYRVQHGWKVEGYSQGSFFEQEHDVILSAVQAYQINNIFDLNDSNTLNDLPYAPLSVIALGFSSDQIAHPLDGFGMLIPEVENYRTLGVLFSSSLFPGRAPKNHTLLTCFIGGARNPELAAQSQSALQAIVQQEIGELLGITGDPVFRHHRYWPATIPQYTLGYDKYLKQMKQIENQQKGLFITGNFRGGISVPDRILSGFETVKKVQTFLNGHDF